MPAEQPPSPTVPITEEALAAFAQRMLRAVLTSPARVEPGEAVTASVLPASPELPALDVLTAGLNLTFLAKSVGVQGTGILPSLPVQLPPAQLPPLSPAPPAAPAAPTPLGSLAPHAVLAATAPVQVAPPAVPPVGVPPQLITVPGVVPPVVVPTPEPTPMPAPGGGAGTPGLGDGGVTPPPGPGTGTLPGTGGGALPGEGQPGGAPGAAPAPTILEGVLGQATGAAIVPTPKVRIAVRWIVRDAATKRVLDEDDFIAANGLDLPEVNVLFPPILKELKLDTLELKPEDGKPALEERELVAEVRLRVGDVAAKVQLPPLKVALVPLPVPTVCVMFNQEDFAPQKGKVVVWLPQDSLLTSLEELMDELRKVESVLGKVRRLGGRFAQLTHFLIGIRAFTMAMPHQPRVRLVIADRIDRLQDVKFYRRYGWGWYPSWADRITGDGDVVNAENRASSLLLLGAPGVRARFYTLDDRARESKDHGKGGVITLDTNPTGFVIARSLKTAAPQSLPPGKLTVQQVPDTGPSFEDKFSSAEFLTRPDDLRPNLQLEMPRPPVAPIMPPAPVVPTPPPAKPKLPPTPPRIGPFR